VVGSVGEDTFPRCFRLQENPGWVETIAQQDIVNVCIVAKSPSSLRNGNVRPSVRMHQRRSHVTDFRDIWYWALAWQFIEKLGIWLKSDKNTRFLT
jgi:hypothetical protein